VPKSLTQPEIPDPPFVAVIGAGPAGLMAAEVAAAAGHLTVVFDRMPSAGRKLLMAGRGGLNLTHSEPLEQFLDRYGPARFALEPAVRAFPPEALIAWCKALGQSTFVGSSGRVFPRAMKASPLLRAWLSRLDRLGVLLLARRRLISWDEATLVFEGGARVAPSATVLAMGGASWPRLGSDGTWADALDGLAVAPLRPANCGFVVAWSEHLRARFAGTPLKRIAMAFGGTTVRGEAIITADGIEGGAVYALSRLLRDAIAADGAAVLWIDLRPDLSVEEVARRLAAPRRGQSLATFLRKAVGLPPVAIALVGEALHRDGPSGSLAELIKALRLPLVAAAPIARAISTAGGVRFASLDESFMLRRRPGTFVAGEMLDWEAPTGGYLLQASFATGAAAGRGVVRYLEDRAA
jgi:hypothetical protein